MVIQEYRALGGQVICRIVDLDETTPILPNNAHLPRRPTFKLITLLSEVDHFTGSEHCSGGRQGALDLEIIPPEEPLLYSKLALLQPDNTPLQFREIYFLLSTCQLLRENLHLLVLNLRDSPGSILLAAQKFLTRPLGI